MLRVALGFFTRIPVSPCPESFRGVAAWLPVVGLIVGSIAAIALWSAAQFFPPVICGILGCLIWVSVTGGLHLDGVADCGDGLVVETTPERRLEIMRDSRLGTFGGTALFFTLTLKAATLTVLAEQSFLNMFMACGLAGLLARSCVFIAMRVRSARPGGLGEALRESVEPKHLYFALFGSLLACLLCGIQGLAALGAALLMCFFLLNTARRRLGGVTGDVFGCLIESVEWIVLLAFCAG